MKKSILFISLVFLALPIIAHSAEILVGLGVGYSRVLVEKQYDQYYWGRDYNGKSYESFAPNLSLELSVGYFSRKFGLTLDIIKQRYDRIYHKTYNGQEIQRDSWASNYLYLCFGAEYRFFADKEKRLDPYINVGLTSLLYFDLFGSGPPDFPETTDARFSGGVRLKTVTSIYINAKISYFPRNSIISGLIGLEAIF